MEYALLGLAAVAMGAGWWWLGRRRKELLGDSDDPSSLIPREDPGPPEVFTRESLVGRPRRFDPAAWDDSPDGGTAAAPADPEELPTHFDRSYLERTTRSSPPVDAPAADSGAAAGPPAAPEPPAVDDDEPAYFDREFLERRERERAKRQQPPAGPEA